MKPIAKLLMLVALLMLCSTASAYIANSSSVVTSYTDTAFANQNYMPYQYEILIIAIAFISWIAMRYYQEVEVLLGLISLISFGIAAWQAAYMCIVEVFTVVDSTTGTTTILYTQLVTPQPIFQILLVVCFLFALLTVIYVVFLREADTKLDKTEIVRDNRRPQ